MQLVRFISGESIVEFSLTYTKFYGQITCAPAGESSKSAFQTGGKESYVARQRSPDRIQCNLDMQSHRFSLEEVSRVVLTESVKKKICTHSSVPSRAVFIMIMRYIPSGI